MIEPGETQHLTLVYIRISASSEVRTDDETVPQPVKMGDVLIDNPINTIPPHKKLPPSDSIPNIDSLEGSGNDSGDEYATLKRYQRHLEYISLQEEYIKDEQRSLKRELVRAQEEIKRIQSVPLVIGQFMEAIDQK